MNTFLRIDNLPDGLDYLDMNNLPNILGMDSAGLVVACDFASGSTTNLATGDQLTIIGAPTFKDGLVYVDSGNYFVSEQKQNKLDTTLIFVGKSSSNGLNSLCVTNYDRALLRGDSIVKNGAYLNNGEQWFTGTASVVNMPNNTNFLAITSVLGDKFTVKVLHGGGIYESTGTTTRPVNFSDVQYSVGWTSKAEGYSGHGVFARNALVYNIGKSSEEIDSMLEIIKHNLNEKGFFV